MLKCKKEPDCNRTWLLLTAMVVAAFALAGQPAWAGIDPGPGTCDPTGIDQCPSDHNACTTERCNTETRRCESVPVVCQSDDNRCTTEVCNPESGACVSVPTEPPPDGCGGEGGCDPTGIDQCPSDHNACTTERCNTETRRCESVPVVCGQNDDLCTVEACDPETGRCESGEPKSCEPDDNECTTEACEPATGRCQSTPTNPPPEGCEGAICRTPGFWGTHAAAATKKRAVNITQMVINAAGGSLSVCGRSITSTLVGDDNSAVEGICVSPRGDSRLQLARQLTAAALNCAMSGGGGDCSGTPLYASVYSACNATCQNSGASTSRITSCISALDCLNNGGTMLASGYCQTGTCAGDGSPCKEGGSCLDDSACVPLDGNCHRAELVNPDLRLDFEPPGPAGSPTECNSATKNACTVIGPGVASCTR